MLPACPVTAQTTPFESSSSSSSSTLTPNPYEVKPQRDSPAHRHLPATPSALAAVAAVAASAAAGRVGSVAAFVAVLPVYVRVCLCAEVQSNLCPLPLFFDGVMKHGGMKLPSLSLAIAAALAAEEIVADALGVAADVVAAGDAHVAADARVYVD